MSHGTGGVRDRDARVGRQDRPARYPPRVSRTPEYAAALRTALGRAVSGADAGELARATEALVARYRSVAPASAPILASRVHVAAYASYRMPATHAALARVLDAVADRGLAPRSLLDLGGGTGAAAWAAAGVFASLESITVLDQVEDALALGRVPRRRRTVAGPGRRDLPSGLRRRVARPGGRPRHRVVRPQRARRAPAGRARRRRDAARTGRRRRRAGHPRRLRPGAARPGGAHGGRLDPARSVPPRGGLSSGARATGATSRLAWNAPPSTAASRAPSCPTRTRSSRGSRPRPRRRGTPASRGDVGPNPPTSVEAQGIRRVPGVPARRHRGS